MSKTTEKPNKNDLRSARTRELILSETLNCIFENGYQNTSTNEIVERAGVSRGAMLHHYPSKEDLVAAALEKLLSEEIAKLRKVAAKYTRGQLSLDDFVDYLWERFSGRLFMITLDYISIARTDDAIQNAMKKPVAEFHDSLNLIWDQFFNKQPGDAVKVQAVFNLTLCVMRGMGAQTVVRKDAAYFDGLRSHWKMILKEVLSVSSTS